MKVTVCRKEHFNAAHRLFNPAWNDAHNLETFGKCSFPNYHGHNYELIVKIKGDVDPSTGYVMDTRVLKELIRQHILEKLDHKNLNLDVKEFSSLNPSAENIAVIIWRILRQYIDPQFELSVVLYETERNFIEYNGE
jgi:6-pyruvoyltetrahydropterin/6-carboxytetrahydropterin synthase